MGPDGWRSLIGDEAWTHLVGPVSDVEAMPGGAEDAVAAVLTRATELGFRAPDPGPHARVRGMGRLLHWEGEEPVLTADGYLGRLEALGAGWFLLRVPQLVRAVGGPLLERLNEIMGLYTVQCEREGVPLLPDGAEVTCFAGADPARALDPSYPLPPDAAMRLFRALTDGAPRRTARVARVAGPGGA